MEDSVSCTLHPHFCENQDPNYEPVGSAESGLDLAHKKGEIVRMGLGKIRYISESNAETACD